ncbi:hypothetical protein MHU86_15228 [Fragilaria crotonensis]|nr:hypothetical protein MHU86_15228 [Fragilaria crotonensis]
MIMVTATSTTRTCHRLAIASWCLAVLSSSVAFAWTTTPLPLVPRSLDRGRTSASPSTGAGVHKLLLSANDRNEETFKTVTSSTNNNVESISLEKLSDNHEEEGSLMAMSVAKWLDAEWMPQEIHVQMGHSAKLSYINCRQEGDSEIMSIMMRIATDLEANWAAYDKDAFVNAWDVANYVSDYLTKKSGSEGCECSSRIY